MAQTTGRGGFHSTAQMEMDKRGWGMRTLAKKLAGEGATHERVEVERRAVRRWFKGAQPSVANRRRVAVALGLPEEIFDDDEEDDSLSSFLHREVELATQRAVRQWEQKQRDRENAPAESGSPA